MTIDEARTWLQHHADNTPMPGAREAYRTILEALKRSRWIPVEERLPEKNESVLVRFETGNMGVCFWVIKDKFTLGWKVWTDDGWIQDCDAGPTHWMPLPEPPEVEQ